MGGPDAGFQFYLGPANSGAQPHSHSHAWNMLAWGRKVWHLWPPADSFYSTTPVRPYVDRVVNSKQARSLEGVAEPMECIQEASDFVYVPNGWGHSAVNLEASVGIAIGFRDDFNLPPTMNQICLGHAEYGRVDHATLVK